MTKIFIGLLLLLSTACLTSARLSASTVLYSNLGPGGSFSGVGYSTSPNAYDGTTFIASGSGELGDLLIALATFPGSPNNTTVTLGLYANSANDPGTLMESWTTTIPVGNPTVPQLSMVSSVPNIFIVGGIQYWVVVSPVPYDTIYGASNQGVTGGLWSGNLVGSSIQLQQVFGTGPMVAVELDAAVPEPVSAIQVYLGLVLIALTVIRKHSRLTKTAA